MSLTIKDLSKNFGDQQVLRDVNLEISRGELVVFVGPSGCGKTTLLRCIAGLERQEEGNIFLDGELIDDIEPKDRNIAMVFQYFALYPHMTVRENMSLGLRYTTNLSKREIEERVKEAASLLKISHLLDRKPAQLSGGEVQRGAIGRAIVRKPKIFLLDEPLSNIDAKFRRELRFEIRRLQKKLGVTTIYVTHDQEEAMAIGDRLVVLKDSVIQQVGTPEDVYNHPGNIFVAVFIGSPPMNFFEVRGRKKGKQFFLEGENFIYEVSQNFYNQFLTKVSDDKLLMGLRPESIKIVEKGKVNSIASTVSLLENVGIENHIHLLLNDIKLIARVSSEINPSVGEKLYISFDENDIHLFHMDNGETLEV